MFRRYLSLALAALLAQTTCFLTPALARAGDREEAKLAQKVKTSLYRLGAGPESRVKVKLLDKSTLEGYVSGIGEDSFEVTDEKTGVATTVTYAEVKQVKGNNFSTGAKIAIGAAIAAGLAVAVILATRGNGRDDSGPIRCAGVTTPCP